MTCNQIVQFLQSAFVQCTIEHCSSPCNLREYALHAVIQYFSSNCDRIFLGDLKQSDKRGARQWQTPLLMSGKERHDGRKKRASFKFACKTAGPQLSHLRPSPFVGWPAVSSPHEQRAHVEDRPSRCRNYRANIRTCSNMRIMHGLTIDCFKYVSAKCAFAISCIQWLV